MTGIIKEGFIERGGMGTDLKEFEPGEKLCISGEHWLDIAEGLSGHYMVCRGNYGKSDWKYTVDP